MKFSQDLTRDKFKQCLIGSICITGLMFLNCYNAQAQTATRCINSVVQTVEHDEDEKEYKITNTCTKSVVVAWCLLKPNENDNDACRSDSDDKFYANAKVLEPGESYRNSFSLNAEYELRYAACYGDNTFSERPESTNKQGDFRCPE